MRRVELSLRRKILRAARRAGRDGIRAVHMAREVESCYATTSQIAKRLHSEGELLKVMQRYYHPSSPPPAFTVTPVRRLILDLLANSDRGMSRGEIVRRLNLPRVEAWMAIRSLIEEGLLIRDTLWGAVRIPATPDAEESSAQEEGV